MRSKHLCLVSMTDRLQGHRTFQKSANSSPEHPSSPAPTHALLPAVGRWAVLLTRTPAQPHPRRLALNTLHTLTAPGSTPSLTTSLLSNTSEQRLDVQQATENTPKSQLPMVTATKPAPPGGPPCQLPTRPDQTQSSLQDSHPLLLPHIPPVTICWGCTFKCT